MTQARKVAILPDDVANQIAAGEVVERPASVVKELVENALDAGASRVDVEIRDAGRGLIRVVDDGVGMSREDASVAILRHATSKLSRADDLLAIETLGFRGEALPSIASVSRFTLVTRRAEDPVATHLAIAGGAAPVLREAAAPVGTRIEVADLFYNVPARRKFLKSDATELAQVQQLMQAFALGYPQIHFRLAVLAEGDAPEADAARLAALSRRASERPLLDHPAVGHLRERAVQVLGRELVGRLHEVSGDHGGVSLVGFTSSPQAAKSHANQLYLFINGRRIRDRAIHHAILSAYGADLPPGRFPQAVIYLHLPPSEVDVNVHPAKAEVRFAQPSLVHQVVFTALRRTLERRPWLAASPLPLEGGPLVSVTPRPAALLASEPRATWQPSLLPYVRRAPEAPSSGFAPGSAAPPTARHDGAELFGPATIPTQGAAPATLAPWVSVPPTHPPSSVGQGASPSGSPEADPQASGHATRGLAPSSAFAAGGGAPPSSVAAARHVGTLGTGHLLVEGPEGLSVIDPVLLGRDRLRAALLTAAMRESVPTKPLVMPVMFEVGARSARLLSERLALLARLGLWIEAFGAHAFQILGLPAPLAGQPAKALALGALSRLERSPQADVTDLVDALVRAVCPEPPADAVAALAAWRALPAEARSPLAVRVMALEPVETPR